MNPKSLAVLAAFLAVLAGLYFLVPSNRLPTTSSGGQAIKQGEKLLDGFEHKNARTISISKAGRTVKLARLNEQRWNIATLKDRKAKNEYVQNLLLGVHHATVERDRPGSLENFGLDEAHRAELEVLDESGAPSAQLYIGKSAGYEKCFAMRKGSATVYEIAPDLESAIGMHTEGEQRALDPEHWYDLVICEYKQADAIEFAIKHGHSSVRVQKVIPGQGPIEPKTPDQIKKEDEAEAKKTPEEKKKSPQPIWWISEPEGLPVNEGNCAAVYNSATQLYAAGYADDIKPEEHGLDNPVAKTRIVLRDGRSFTFVLGKRMKEYGILKVEGQPEVWKIEGFTYEKFSQTLNQLKKEDAKTQPGTQETKTGDTAKPPPIDPAKTVTEPAPPPREEIPDAPPPATKEQLEQRKPKAPPAVLKSE